MFNPNVLPRLKNELIAALVAPYSSLFSYPPDFITEAKNIILNAKNPIELSRAFFHIEKMLIKKIDIALHQFSGDANPETMLYEQKSNIHFKQAIKLENMLTQLNSIMAKNINVEELTNNPNQFDELLTPLQQQNMDRISAILGHTQLEQQSEYHIYLEQTLAWNLSKILFIATDPNHPFVALCKDLHQVLINHPLTLGIETLFAGYSCKATPDTGNNPNIFAIPQPIGATDQETDRIYQNKSQFLKNVGFHEALPFNFYRQLGGVQLGNEGVASSIIYSVPRWEEAQQPLQQSIDMASFRASIFCGSIMLDRVGGFCYYPNLLQLFHEFIHVIDYATATSREYIEFPQDGKPYASIYSDGEEAWATLLHPGYSEMDLFAGLNLNLTSRPSYTQPMIYFSVLTNQKSDRIDWGNFMQEYRARVGEVPSLACLPVELLRLAATTDHFPAPRNNLQLE